MPDNPHTPDNEGVIKRYDAEPGAQPLSEGDGDLIGSISDHIERHLGPVEQVFHEIVSPTVHVDIHWVAPKRPWHILVTSGMSERPMTVPEELADFRYAELMVSLPASWPISMEAFEDEANYWPIRWPRGDRGPAPASRAPAGNQFIPRASEEIPPTEGRQ